MKDDLNGRQTQWKTTSMEDNLNGRRPQRKTTSKEDNLNGRQTQWQTDAMEDDLNGRRPHGRQPHWKTISMEEDRRKQMISACLASKSFTELGPAQPQLVFLFLLTFLKVDRVYNNGYQNYTISKQIIESK